MKKAAKFLVPLILSVLIILSIFWYLFIYDRTFTRDTLLSQARFHDTNGNAKISSWFYKAAYNFSGKDEDVAIELANQYKYDGNFTKAEATLTAAINSRPTADLFAALCQTYVQQDKLLDAVMMLEYVNDPQIKAELEAKRPTAPGADYAAGYYSQYMDIHLSSSADTIYYSTNMEFPSTAGLTYDSSIHLDAGETTIYAIGVDKNGLVSPVTILGYTITGVIEPVTFADPTMEAAIRSLIGADSDDTVYTNQLWEITEFTTPAGVSTYADLAKLPYLQKLTIRNQSVDSLYHLSGLGSLMTLDLSGSRFPVDELTVLTSLPVLKELNLSECGLSTIAGLAGAPSLEVLNLTSNTVRNLDVLSPMTSLREIYLKHNAVTDLAALSSLVNLEKLDVGYNSISTLIPLEYCAKLSWLDAGNNNLTWLHAVDKLPLLSYLNVEYNHLTDVAILGKCTELTELSVASNTISSIYTLDDLTKLEIFDFSGNQITDLPAWPEGCALKTVDGSYNALTSIDGLSKMQQLSHVYMDYNLLTNIDALSNCYCLVQVNVFGNPIGDVSQLRDHDIIVNYDPTAA